MSAKKSLFSKKKAIAVIITVLILVPVSLVVANWLPISKGQNNDPSSSQPKNLQRLQIPNSQNSLFPLILNATANPPPFDKSPAPMSTMGVLAVSRVLSHAKVSLPSNAAASAPAATASSSNAVPLVTSNSASTPTSSSPTIPIVGNTATLFNKETMGNVPQDEESVAAFKPTTCTTPSTCSIVLEGANDYRGLFGLTVLCGGLGGSGYYVSNTGGASVLKEGCLPPLTGITFSCFFFNGTTFCFSTTYGASSFGDPAVGVFNGNGTFFYASLYEDGVTGVSAVGLAKATPTNLQNTGLTDTQTWAVTQVVANSSFFAFNDKPWMTIDNVPGTVNYGHIYVTWTSFTFSGSTIMIADCTQNPFTCTTIGAVNSPSTFATQGSFVSVDSSGNVTVTFTNYNFFGDPNPPYFTQDIYYTFYHSARPLASAPTLGPIFVTHISAPLSLGLQAIQGNEFRVPVLPQSAVAKTSSGIPELVIAYNYCGSNNYLLNEPQFAFAILCSHSVINVIVIDRYATSPTTAFNFLISLPIAHVFFPALSVNQPLGVLDMAYYSTDATKQSLFVTYQQLSLSTFATLVAPTQLLTLVSAPDADSFFFPHGAFIGDYIQLTTLPGSATAGTNNVFIGFNSNNRFAANIYYAIPSFFGTFLVNFGGTQDDNYVWHLTY